MMTDIVIEKFSESKIKIHCSKSIASEINEAFSFFAPGYKFSPAFRQRLWNGKIYLFNTSSQTIYYGLADHIIAFCADRNYSYVVDERIVSQSVDEVLLDKFIKDLNLIYELQDYQRSAFIKSVNEQRCLTVSATGSGKSLLLYLLCRYYSDKKILLVVPTINLVNQMYSDFEEYSQKNKFDVSGTCHKIYTGKEKNSKARIYISTYQSLNNIENKKYFEQFDCVMIDEAHQATSQSIKKILENCSNAYLRFGCTGTLKDSKCHHLVLEGLIGKAFTASRTHDLMERKILADLKIKCVMLKYDEETCRSNKNLSYDEEINFIVASEIRNTFISNLALSLNDNTLLLFNYVEKHGKPLYELLKKKAIERKLDKKIFYISGETDPEIREQIRHSIETEKNCIIVASIGVFSTGVNIKNLENVIFASPTKSKIRTLQSIGRALRIGRSSSATLYDIVDDMTHKKHKNYAYRHFVERAELYAQERFKFKMLNVKLFDTVI